MQYMYIESGGKISLYRDSFSKSMSLLELPSAPRGL